MDRSEDQTFPTSHIENMVKALSKARTFGPKTTSAFLTDDFLQTMKKAEANIMGSARKLTEAMQTVNSVQPMLRTAFNNDAIIQFMEQQKAFSRRFSSIFENNTSLVGAANIAHIRSSFAVLEQIQNLPLEELYEEKFNEIKEEELHEPESDEFFIKLFLYLREKATELPNGQISALGLAKLAVSCLILYVGLKSASEAKKDREESIRIQKSTNRKIEVFTNKLSSLLTDLEESEKEEFIVSIKRECPNKIYTHCRI